MMGVSVRLAGLAALTLVAACAATRATDGDGARSAGGMLTTRDGAYTPAQAERGRQVYGAYCVSCHPTAFYEAQLLVWQDAAVSELLEALRATMPAENPGALATSQYLDVLAYIFSITGSPAGEQALTVDNASTVRIANDQVPASR